jgi:hypothetical protein
MNHIALTDALLRFAFAGAATLDAQRQAWADNRQPLGLLKTQAPGVYAGLVDHARVLAARFEG